LLLLAWRPSWREALREYAMVVAGVLTAFAVTAWWEDRQEAGLERAYLLQLHADLTTSERILAEGVEFIWGRAEASALVLHSFWQSDPPPADSLVVWLRAPMSFRPFRPILGTVEALVSTGDLRLVRDDSLRAQVVTYLETTRGHLADAERYEQTYYRSGVATVRGRIDPGALVVMAPETAAGTAIAPGSGASPVPLEYDRVPFPVDLPAILRDRQVYVGDGELLVAHRNIAARYVEMLDEARALRVRIGEALNNR
jgi:hypothetical protein